MFWFVGRCSEACRWQLKDSHLLSLTLCQRSWELAVSVAGGTGNCFLTQGQQGFQDINTAGWWKTKNQDAWNIWCVCDECIETLKPDKVNNTYHFCYNKKPLNNVASTHSRITKTTQKWLWGTWNLKKSPNPWPSIQTAQVHEMHRNKPHPPQHPKDLPGARHLKKDVPQRSMPQWVWAVSAAQRGHIRQMVLMFCLFCLHIIFYFIFLREWRSENADPTLQFGLMSLGLKLD